MTKTPDRAALLENWRVVRWARDAESFHRRRGQYEQAVGFQQIADAVEQRGTVLDCEFIFHECVAAKAKDNEGFPL